VREVEQSWIIALMKARQTLGEFAAQRTRKDFACKLDKDCIRDSSVDHNKGMLKGRGSIQPFLFAVPIDHHGNRAKVQCSLIVFEERDF
jgi:hypothetical protein